MSPAIGQAVVATPSLEHAGSNRDTASAAAARPLSIVLRKARPADSEAIHALVADHAAQGRLLPRTREEVELHAPRFVVAVHDGRVVACADLAPLSRAAAEVRSLVVSAEVRSLGIGRQIIGELVRRASSAGFEKLCAFTHSPAYFVQMGFSIVPHVWLPEKIRTDCRGCVHFRQCGQYAVMLALATSRHSCVPLASLHG